MVCIKHILVLLNNAIKFRSYTSYQWVSELSLRVSREIFQCGPNVRLQQGTKCNCLFLRINAFLRFFWQSSGQESAGCWWGHWTHSFFACLHITGSEECSEHYVQLGHVDNLMPNASYTWSHFGNRKNIAILAMGNVYCIRDGFNNPI